MKLFFKSLFLLFQFGLFEISVSQESLAPASFIRVESGGKKLPTQIAEAQQRFQRDQDGDRFWIGYALTIRDGFDFDEIYIHDNGGITISRGGKGDFFIHEDDEGEIEEAAAESEESRNVIQYNVDQIAVFLQLQARTLQIKKITASNFSRKKVFRDAPGYWLSEVESGDSFTYLAETISNASYNKKIIEPALCLISLHDHPQAIPFLTHTAGGDQHIEIRKSAAFWLGQIPVEASFTTLVQLFEKEQEFEMKEHLVFAIGQHGSEKVIGQLEKIARSREDFDIREKAVFWIGQIERDDALDVLIELMKISGSELKEKIVFSISQHKSERAAPLLIEIAESDRDREVRKQAIFWLGQMASKRTLHALGDIVESADETETKEQAVFAISQHADHDEAFDMLMDIAKHNPNPEVRKEGDFLAESNRR